MNKQTILMILILYISSFSIFAGSGTFTFNQIGVVREGTLVYGIVQLEGLLPTVPTCANGFSHQLTFLISGDHGKLLYSNALIAVTAQKKVWLTYSDTDCGWAGTRPVSDRIDIQK